MEGPLTHFATYGETIPYTKADGTSASVEVPFVELPAGTLLFRGVQLPNPKKDEDPRLFVRDWLGYPTGERFCMTPTHNTFFYTSPYVPFGAHTVGEWFNAILVYLLVKPVRLVCMIGPQKWIRGGKELKALDGTAPIQRCDKFDFSCLSNQSSPQAKKEKELKAWDNCIHPDFAQAKQVSGWMAIADYDSLDNYKEGLHGKETTMGKYIMELEQHLPGKGVELLTSTYTDASSHRGFPEVVLFPWNPHPGAENQYTEAGTEEEAADAIAELSDRFTYLPMACITERGILEAYTGDFKAGDLPAYATTAVPGPVTRKAVDKNLAAYMDRLTTSGVTIPDVGSGVVQFDSRTGFYRLSLLPTEIQTPLGMIDYETLCRSVATPEERAKVTEYKIKYRTFDNRKLQVADTFLDGSPVPTRNFIFERPDQLYPQFKELSIKMPGQYVPFIWSATETFQTNLANRKQSSDPRGAEEARRRAAEAKQKVQESLEVLSKKRGKTLGAKKGGRRGTRKIVRASLPPLRLSEFRGGGCVCQLDETFQKTLSSFWTKASKRSMLAF